LDYLSAVLNEFAWALTWVSYDRLPLYMSTCGTSISKESHNILKGSWQKKKTEQVWFFSSTKSTRLNTIKGLACVYSELLVIITNLFFNKTDLSVKV